MAVNPKTRRNALRDSLTSCATLANVGNKARPAGMITSRVAIPETSAAMK
tara:strand:- start:29 stop:178 length:150 start_codon:yes stop_codon:yes gene_type:complete